MKNLLLISSLVFLLSACEEKAEKKYPKNDFSGKQTIPAPGNNSMGLDDKLDNEQSSDSKKTESEN